MKKKQSQREDRSNNYQGGPLGQGGDTKDHYDTYRGPDITNKDKPKENSNNSQNSSEKK